jgi:hypothetical protein
MSTPEVTGDQGGERGGEQDKDAQGGAVQPPAEEPKRASVPLFAWLRAFAWRKH